MFKTNLGTDNVQLALGMCETNLGTDNFQTLTEIINNNGII